MFPYPSGSGLHVGHPLGYIASDIISRYSSYPILTTISRLITKIIEKMYLFKKFGLTSLTLFLTKISPVLFSSLIGDAISAKRPKK